MNLVLRGKTELSPEELLRQIHQIEAAAGRERKIHWGPRSLDIDILLYGNKQIAEPELLVPHPGIAERAFVLVPWVEIAPTVTIPGLNKNGLAVVAGFETG